MQNAFCEFVESNLVLERLEILITELTRPRTVKTSLQHNALRRRLAARVEQKSDKVTPMERMQHCRKALERLDKAGWKRSYHQRLFHDDFLVSLFV